MRTAARFKGDGAVVSKEAVGSTLLIPAPSPCQTNPDRVLFHLCDEWAVGWNDQQWIVYRVYFKHDAERFLPVSFIGGTKKTLLRIIDETGVVPTPQSQVALDALPDTFKEFRSQSPADSGGRLDG